MRRLNLIGFFFLILVACDGGGSSEPLQYPEEYSETQSSSVKSSAKSSDELISSVAEISSSEEGSSSEALSNSSSSVDGCSSSIQNSSSVEKSSSSSMFLYVSYGTMTDKRDGQVYKTMTIEGEFVDCSIYNPTPIIIKLPKTTWMLENLRYAYLQPTTTLDSSSWNISHNATYAEEYGRLYLWSAAMDSAALFSDESNGCGFFATEEEWYKCSLKKGKRLAFVKTLLGEKRPFGEAWSEGTRGVCPEGWHLPTYDEDIALITWRWCCDKFDEFNASKPLAGLYDAEKKIFSSFKRSLFYWTATENNYKLANADHFDRSNLGYSEGHSINEGVSPINKNYALSVRCIKD